MTEKARGKLPSLCRQLLHKCKGGFLARIHPPALGNLTRGSGQDGGGVLYSRRGRSVEARLSWKDAGGGPGPGASRSGIGRTLRTVAPGRGALGRVCVEKWGGGGLSTSGPR